MSCPERAGRAMLACGGGGRLVAVSRCKTRHDLLGVEGVAMHRGHPEATRQAGPKWPNERLGAEPGRAGSESVGGFRWRRRGGDGARLTFTSLMVMVLPRCVMQNNCMLLDAPVEDPDLLASLSARSGSAARPPRRLQAPRRCGPATRRRQRQPEVLRRDRISCKITAVLQYTGADCASNHGRDLRGAGQVLRRPR